MAFPGADSGFSVCGVGLFFAACNTYLRDIAPLVTIAAMVLMWSTPMFTRWIAEECPGIGLVDYSPESAVYLVMIHHHLFLYNNASCLLLVVKNFRRCLCLGYWFLPAVMASLLICCRIHYRYNLCYDLFLSESGYFTPTQAGVSATIISA